MVCHPVRCCWLSSWVPAKDYLTPVTEIATVTAIQGLLVDSLYVKEYSVQQYLDRTVEYLDQLGAQVALWQVLQDAMNSYESAH